jgi:membrane protein DedA with SNARE-associated domain
VYPVLALLVAAETAVLPGVVVPSLALLLTAGYLAAAGTLWLPGVLLTAAAAAAAGDAIGFHTARALGPRLRRGAAARPAAVRHWRRAEALAARYGAWAMLVGRFIPFVRTLTPHVVGLGGRRYRDVAPGALLGAAGWAVLEVGAGALAGVTAAPPPPRRPRRRARARRSPA